MPPAKKAITQCPAQQTGQGRALGCPRSVTAPGHGGAPCLSFPICSRGLVAWAGRRCGQPGPWHRRRAGVGAHRSPGLFSNLKSNLALPPRPGLAAMMNELSGSRRHAPPPTAPPAPPAGAGAGMCPLDARSPSLSPAPLAPGMGTPSREGGTLPPASGWEGPVGRSRQGARVGGQV